MTASHVHARVMSLNVAIGVGGIAFCCVMVVFLALLCVHQNRAKPKPSVAQQTHGQHSTPAQKLEDKIRQVEIDATRGDSFGSDDDGDGDGDGDGP